MMCGRAESVSTQIQTQSGDYLEKCSVNPQSCIWIPKACELADKSSNHPLHLLGTFSLTMSMVPYLIISLGGHTLWYSGLSPGSECRDHSWRDHIWCQGSNQGQLNARRCPLCYLSSPKAIGFIWMRQLASFISTLWPISMTSMT